MSLLDIIMHTRFERRQRNIELRELHLHPTDWNELAKDVEAKAYLYAPQRMPLNVAATLDGVNIMKSHLLEPGTFLLMPVGAFVDWRCKVHDDCKQHPEMARECALLAPRKDSEGT